MLRQIWEALAIQLDPQLALEGGHSAWNYSSYQIETELLGIYCPIKLAE
jgi:hypothetical protein